MIRRLRQLSLIMLSICVITGTAEAAGEFGAIDVQVDQNDQMTIALNVSGVDAFGVLDTAATYPLVDDDVLISAQAADRDQLVAVLGLAGTLTFETASVESLRVGNMNLSNVAVGVNDQGRFPGHKSILPANAFDARVIDFDFSRNRIELYDRRPKSTGDAVRSRLPYQEIQGLPFVKVKLNGKSGLALIDTGSSETYINHAYARLAGANLQVDRTQQLYGADAKNTGVSVMSAKRFTIGKHGMQDFLILAADPPLFDYLGLNEEPIMVLGLDTLKHFRMQIDREKKFIHFSRAEDRKEGRRYRVQPFSSRIRPDQRRD